MITEKTSCPINQTISLPLKEPTIKKLIRKTRELIKPTHCSIRFDVKVGKWAVLDKNNEPTRHFEYGIMENVRFSSATVQEGYGCGSKSTSIGIATGDLRQDTYGSDVMGYHNMSFKGGNFIGEDGLAIREASSLRLLTERRALYK